MRSPDEIWIGAELVYGEYEFIGVYKERDSDIPYIRKDLVDEKDKQIVTLIKDESDDDTAIRKLALTVLPEKDVNGDTFGVPDIVTIVETLVRRIKVLERALKISDESLYEHYINMAEQELEQDDDTTDR